MIAIEIHLETDERTLRHRRIPRTKRSRRIIENKGNSEIREIIETTSSTKTQQTRIVDIHQLRRTERNQKLNQNLTQ